MTAAGAGLLDVPGPLAGRLFVEQAPFVCDLPLHLWLTGGKTRYRSLETPGPCGSRAAEVHAQLAAAAVRHCWIEGDYLDLAYPSPWRTGLHLAEENLAAVWANYRRAGTAG